MVKLLEHQVCCPGKVIISGEHSVVYGCPALVMSVPIMTQATVQWIDEPLFQFHFVDLNDLRTYSIDDLAVLKTKLDTAYEMFSRGEISISEVLNEKAELIPYFFACLGPKLPKEGGIRIRFSSGLPMGCGMGSSASMIGAAYLVVEHLFPERFSREELWNAAKKTEDLCHGKSSGIDLHAVIQGGTHLFRDGTMIPLRPSKRSWFLLNTGSPESTTGECVSFASKAFEEPSVKSEFTRVTERIASALLQTGNDRELMRLIDQNSTLLIELGVVPQKAQRLIRRLSKEGIAAKLSGGGAVIGDHAGILLVLSPDGHIPDWVREEVEEIYTINGDVL